MRYQLINPVDKSLSAVEQVLYNRGINPKDLERFKYPSSRDIIDPLCLENMHEGAKMLIKHIGRNDKIFIQVDSDCDGYTSAAILINYLNCLFPHFVQTKIIYRIHDGKQHGLLTETIPDDVGLVIAPDSSSNDYIQHEELAKKGIDVLVLDHHEADRVSEYATVINNQLSEYPNKDMSGVGVVWQFCRYLDSIIGANNADKYLDLVALGMDADMMSMASLETKHLINKGLQNVTNPFFSAMVEKNSYSMKNKVTPFGVAFYVAPYVNAVVRSGTQEEKEIIFQSMLNFKAFEKILSNKRGHRPGEMEQLYVQAIRTATNVKNRQTRAQDAGLAFLEEMIEKENLLEHKVLLFLLTPGQIDRNIAGLIANKFMAKYQRPCCILTRVEENGVVSYQGSARGCDKTGIVNFKDICEQTGCIMYAEGHQGAFGLGIELGYLQDFINKTDEILKDTSDEVIYYVDYIYRGNDVNPNHILEIAELDYLWGKDMEEPLIAIKGLKITKDMVTLMSPGNKPTLKIILPNGVSLIKFGSSEDEKEIFSREGYVEVDFIGRCNQNEWAGRCYPQIYIEDYEVIDHMKYVF